MSQDSEFSFARARRVKASEHQKFVDALSKQFGIQPQIREQLIEKHQEKKEPIN